MSPSDVRKTNANSPSVRQRPWLSGKRDLLLCQSLQHYLFIPIANQWKSKGAVKGVNIRLPLFQTFSLSDLNRLKDNSKWLTDTHVTFALMFVIEPHSLYYFEETYSCQQGQLPRKLEQKYLGKPQN
jgi:hypothetical protein